MHFFLFYLLFPCLVHLAHAARDASCEEYDVVFANTKQPLSPISEEQESSRRERSWTRKQLAHGELPSIESASHEDRGLDPPRHRSYYSPLRSKGPRIISPLSSPPLPSLSSPPLPPLASSLNHPVDRRHHHHHHRHGRRHDSPKYEPSVSSANSGSPQLPPPPPPPPPPPGFLPSSYPFRPEPISQAMIEPAQQDVAPPPPLTRESMKAKYRRIRTTLQENSGTMSDALKNESSGFVARIPMQDILTIITNDKNAFHILKEVKALLQKQIVDLPTIQRRLAKASTLVASTSAIIRQYK